MSISDMFKGFTDPNGAISRGHFPPQEDDIVLEPTKNSFGETIHAMPKDFNQEVQEMISSFNAASNEAQLIFIQKIVKNYPREVAEFYNEELERKNPKGTWN